MNKYVLNSIGEPVIEPDVLAWASWYEQKGNGRVVKQEMIGQTRVSTVFLALDHNFEEGQPILWETMCFGGPMDQQMDRCGGTREQAEAMHEAMCAKVRALQLKP